MTRVSSPAPRDVVAAVTAGRPAIYRGAEWECVSAYIFRAEFRGHDGVDVDGVLACRSQAELSMHGGHHLTVCDPRLVEVDADGDAAEIPARIVRLTRAVKSGEAAKVGRKDYARIAAVIYRRAGWSAELVRSDGRRETAAADRVRLADDPPEARTRFVRPTVAEVAAYCAERGNHVNAEAFVNFYDSKGWKIGKESMKDWRAAVRTWEMRDRAPEAAEDAPRGSFDTDEFFAAAVKSSRQYVEKIVGGKNDV